VLLGFSLRLVHVGQSLPRMGDELHFFVFSSLLLFPVFSLFLHSRAVASVIHWLYLFAQSLRTLLGSYSRRGAILYTVPKAYRGTHSQTALFVMHFLSMCHQWRLHKSSPLVSVVLSLLQPLFLCFIIQFFSFALFFLFTLNLVTTSFLPFLSRQKL